MRPITKSSRITLVEPAPTSGGMLDGPPVGDVYSKFPMPRALPTLAAVLREAGYQNVRMISPFFHGQITSEANWARIKESDILLGSAITRTSQPTQELFERCRAVNRRCIIGVGGMDPTFRAESYLEAGADFVVRGEGEGTLREVMARLFEREDLGGCLGVTHKQGKEIIVNPSRPDLSLDELDALPVPYFDEAMIKGMPVAPVEQLRGCPHKCKFCSVQKVYNGRVRCFRTETVARRLEALRRVGLDKAQFFTGDNFVGNPAAALRTVEMMIDRGYRTSRTTVVQIDASGPKHEDLLIKMKLAGITGLCVGLESVSSSSLTEMGKAFTSEQNLEAVRIYRKHGFWIHGMMIVGWDSDNPESIGETLEFAQENLDSLQLFAPTALPGTELWDEMEADGRILTRDFSLYDCQHVMFHPAKMSAYRLQLEINKAIKQFYSPSWTAARLRRSSSVPLAVAIGGWAMFGGIRRGLYDPNSRQHLQNLKELERRTIY